MIDALLLRDYFEGTESWGLELDVAGISFEMESAVERLAVGLTDPDSGPDTFDEMAALIGLIAELPIGCDYWTAQNHYYALLQARYPEVKEAAESGDGEAQSWVASFERLGGALAVYVG